MNSSTKYQRSLKLDKIISVHSLMNSLGGCYAQMVEEVEETLVGL